MARYRFVDGQVEVRSAGADAEVGTSDDVVFLSTEEQQRLERFSGCYEMLSDWWVQWQGTSRIVLDTAMDQEGLYPLQGGSYPANWIPLSADSLNAGWLVVDYGVEWTPRMDGDSLFGRVSRAQGDYLVARRMPC